MHVDSVLLNKVSLYLHGSDTLSPVYTTKENGRLYVLPSKCVALVGLDAKVFSLDLIPDLPTADSEAQMRDFIDKHLQTIVDYLHAGETIVVSCPTGSGCSVTLAIAVLLKMGADLTICEATRRITDTRIKKICSDFGISSMQELLTRINHQEHEPIILTIPCVNFAFTMMLMEMFNERVLL